MPGVTLTFQDTANERSEAVFQMLDKDDDGELDEEEFVAGCLRDERTGWGGGWCGRLLLRA